MRRAGAGGRDANRVDHGGMVPAEAPADLRKRQRADWSTVGRLRRRAEQEDAARQGSTMSTMHHPAHRGRSARDVLAAGGATEPVIRRALPDDAAAVAAVLNSVILEEEYTALTHIFTEEEERDFIDGLCDRSALFVAALGDRIVGIQSIEPDAAARYTDSMRHVATVGTWIHTSCRGRGIGPLLAAASFAFAGAHGYEKIAIQVLADNQRALRFYSGLGFEKVGVARRHVRLGSGFRDVVYLEKFL